jgi:hypothetical protein
MPGGGVTLQASPAVVVSGHDPNTGWGNLDVFATGSNGLVYTAWFRPGGWQGWQEVRPGTLPGGVTLQGGPAVVASYNPNNPGSLNLDVFAAGSNGLVYTARWRPGGWRRWRQAGSPPQDGISLQASPAVVGGNPPAPISAFAAGDDGQIYRGVFRSTCPRNNLVGQVQRGLLGGEIDCAVATSTTRPVNFQIVGIGPITGVVDLATLFPTGFPLDVSVRKRGRTTLLTFGFVDSVDATLTIDYGPSIGAKTLDGQIGIKPDTSQNPRFSAPGDSGSVVVDDQDRVVGLLFAGATDGSYTYANPIVAVLDGLDVSM